MKKRNFIFFSLCLAFVALANSACVEQKPTVAIASPNVVSENMPSTDARIQKAQALVEKRPNVAGNYNNLVIAYIKSARETGDFSLNSKAETALSRSLEIEPNNLNALKLKASLHLTFHRFQDALELGTELQKTNPNDPFIYGVLTDANVELGNYEKAVEAAQTMVDLRPNMESYARVSHLRSLHGDSKGAIEAMSFAARITDPLDKEARSWCLVHLGNEYLKAGKYVEAEKQYDSALEIFPNYHYGLEGKGRARAAQNDYENAIKFLTQSQDRVPTTETVIALGDLYAKTGNAEKAKAQYDLVEFIEQKFGNTDMRRLALLWADQDVKIDEALAIAEKEHAARKDIYTADIYAWCLYKKGRFQEAKAAINEAMRLKTKDARIFYHAGMIEKGLGNKKAANDFLQKSLKTNPAFDVLRSENAKAVLQGLN